MVPLLPVLITLVLTLVNAAVAHAGPWTPPLPGASVVREFDFDVRTPFARGAHRGVRLAGAPGAVVRAPCSGRVTFAGRHPRLGPGLTLRCGALVATEFGLERASPRRSALVAAGMPVGRLGRRGALYLGARTASQRWGYRDPLRLIAAPPGAPAPLAPAPRPRPRRPRPPVVRPGPAVDAAPRAVAPPITWAALGAAGIGAGAGVGLRRRGRRSGTRAPGRRARSGQPTH